MTKVRLGSRELEILRDIAHGWLFQTSEIAETKRVIIFKSRNPFTYGPSSEYELTLDAKESRRFLNRLERLVEKGYVTKFPIGPSPTYYASLSKKAREDPRVMVEALKTE